jgi:hypothetical protein
MRDRPTSELNILIVSIECQGPGCEKLGGVELVFHMDASGGFEFLFP